MYEPHKEKTNTRFLGAVAAIVIGIALLITADAHGLPKRRSPILGIGILTFGIIYIIILAFRSRKKDS
jgi:ABC-type enterobactin transport system permease subunit